MIKRLPYLFLLTLVWLMCPLLASAQFNIDFGYVAPGTGVQKCQSLQLNESVAYPYFFSGSTSFNYFSVQWPTSLPAGPTAETTVCASFFAVPTESGGQGGGLSAAYESATDAMTSINVNFSAIIGTAPTPFLGAVNPKYIVVGVEYAPPGADSSVSYTQDTSFGNNSTSSSSFTTAYTATQTLSGKAGLFGWLSGKATTTQSETYQQETSSSTTIAVTQTISNKNSLNGALDPVNGVNHNYDLIYVWLNPVATYTLTTNVSGAPTSVTFSGFGYDLTDPTQPNDLDVEAIPLGCINGYFTATGNTAWETTCSTTIASRYARTWALTNTDGTGPGLNATDLANIADADPFNTPGYVPTLPIGSYTTTDGRFMECDNPECSLGINFIPGSSDTYSQGYSTTTTITNSYTTTTSYSIAQTLTSQAFWGSFTLALENQYKVTWTYGTSTQVTETSGQVAGFTIVGPPAGYSGPGTFTILQDNYWGTFAFYSY